MAKTYEEIIEKIKNRKAVVLNAEEVISLVEEKGIRKAAEEVDVVTTATFGPMCSSGAFLNFGHTKPKMKMSKVWLNNVHAYAGLAAVDAYIGATELQENDPANSNHPGKFSYGGAHVIQDLIAGKDVKLKAIAYGTDCYPRKEIQATINIKELNEAYLFNPRNCYQNYNIAVNPSHKVIYTYLGTLKPDLGNANYCSAGQLSPLLNDPYYRTIGIGTKVWIGGAQGFVSWQGTQHDPNSDRNDKGIPKGGAGTLALIGDLKKMSQDYVRAVSLQGYGVSLSMGVGIPIPILNEEMMRYVSVKDSDISAPIIDYSDAYPNFKQGTLGRATYEQLKSGSISVQGKDVPTSSLSSYPKALEIANILKKDIHDGKFVITKPVQLLPAAGDDYGFRSPLR